jgi:hypothetical protein
MFTHPQFSRFPAAGIPLNQDLVIMDEKCVGEYEREWVQIFDGGAGEPYSVGYVTRVAARSIGDAWIELSWYVNISLKALRDRIDAIAEGHPSLAFISFADALVVKQVWSLGHVDSTIRYSYSPEALFPPIIELRRAINEVLGLDAYTILTQGMNAFDDPAPLYVSARHNHISLNSLGVPFAQLMAIETAARRAIRAGEHGAHSLYMDTLLVHSLNIDYKFRQSLPRWPYESPMTRSAGAMYVCTDIQAVLDNLE